MALSQEKADLIASEYCTNGYNKEQALIKAGYSHTYARNGAGHKLFDNVRIKQAIERIQACSKAKTGFTVQDNHDLFVRAYELAVECKQPSAMVSAAVGIARLYGYDKDNDLNSGMAKHKPLTAEEIELLKAQAKAITSKAQAVVCDDTCLSHNSGQSHNLRIHKDLKTA